MLPGLITSAQSGFFTVTTRQVDLVCTLRGKLKQKSRTGDLAAIGDRVLVRQTEAERGVIFEIEPRQSLIARQAPTPRGEYQQIIIANPDQIIYVFACSQPAPRIRMLDRFLVIAEKQNIPAAIVANKVDLVGMDHAHQQFDHYQPLGYRVFYTSTRTHIGIDDLHAYLIDKISALAGPSGVGKSSLLNAIQPGLGLAVQHTSVATGKGRHTTVDSRLIRLEGGGYVADTPGLRSLALWDIEAEELDGYFPEIKPLVSLCQFNDCTHITEPGCAVREAADKGTIHPDRYESYVRLRQGEE